MRAIRPELLDELLMYYQKPENLLGQDGPPRQHANALVECALGGELTHHPMRKQPHGFKASPFYLLKCVRPTRISSLSAGKRCVNERPSDVLLLNRGVRVMLLLEAPLTGTIPVEIRGVICTYIQPPAYGRCSPLMNR
jgi:hypothetical protein